MLDLIPQRALEGMVGQREHHIHLKHGVPSCRRVRHKRLDKRERDLIGGESGLVDDGVV